MRNDMTRVIREINCVVRSGKLKGSPQEQTQLSQLDSMSEFIFLGMRLTQGINRQEFYRQFGKNIEELFGTALEKHIKLGTIACQSEHYFLTDYGIDVSNIVLSDFIT
jgi:oxygen-independent coproporphyrinogen-3 oxidase